MAITIYDKINFFFFFFSFIRYLNFVLLRWPRNDVIIARRPPDPGTPPPTAYGVRRVVSHDLCNSRGSRGHARFESTASVCAATRKISGLTACAAARRFSFAFHEPTCQLYILTRRRRYYHHYYYDYNYNVYSENVCNFSTKQPNRPLVTSTP